MMRLSLRIEEPLALFFGYIIYILPWTPGALIFLRGGTAAHAAASGGMMAFEFRYSDVDSDSRNKILK